VGVEGGAPGTLCVPGAAPRWYWHCLLDWLLPRPAAKVNCEVTVEGRARRAATRPGSAASHRLQSIAAITPSLEGEKTTNDVEWPPSLSMINSGFDSIIQQFTSLVHCPASFTVHRAA
jgi:hypothetical protein